MLYFPYPEGGASMTSQRIGYGAERMATSGVNLDALIQREDLSNGPPFKGNPTGNISMAMLTEEFYASSFRKPDFQRETSNWTPQKIADLVASFLDGDLIPAIILWRTGQHIFVIDGAHRLSAMLAWIHDDYGDRSRSTTFFENQVPEEQKKLAEQTRKLIASQVGTYSSYRDAQKNAYAEENIKQRIGNLTSNSFMAQWVLTADASGAEDSFFRINQAPTTVDPVEKRILRERRSAAAIATRAINRGGVGHKYWGDFSSDAQREIERLGREIYEALYSPPMGGAPIKTSDVPVAGRGYSSLPFVFELVSLLSGVSNRGRLPEDSDGKSTIKYMNKVQKQVAQITTTAPGSLGLHPLVYFYTRGGAFQPVAFLAAMQLFGRMQADELISFTSVRRSFEDFLITHKEAATLIVKRQGAGSRSRPALEDFLSGAIQGFIMGKDADSVVQDLARSDKRFSFLVVPAPIREAGDHGQRRFSASTKTAAFVATLAAQGVRCAVCGALLHRNSMHADHIQRRADGGDASPGNAQLAHPFCDSTFKERSISSRAESA